MSNLKRLVESERESIVESYENGKLFDYLSERVLEVKRDEETNELEYLVFTIGGPAVHLDMGVERRGCICGYSGFEKKAYATIPYDKWENIELEILEIFEN